MDNFGEKSLNFLCGKGKVQNQDAWLENNLLFFLLKSWSCVFLFVLWGACAEFVLLLVLVDMLN